MNLPDSLLSFCQAPQQFLLDLVLAEGPAARFRLNDEQFIALGEPAWVHAVMNGAFDDFKKGAMAEVPRTTIGNGLITAEGSDWVEQHAMLAPQFARRRIRELEPLIERSALALVSSWARLPPRTPVDLLNAARRFALDVVARGMFGLEDEELNDALFQALLDADNLESVRLAYLVKRFGTGLAPGGATFERSVFSTMVERLDGLLAIAVDQLLARPAPVDDLAGSVLAHASFLALDPQRQRRFLRDLVATMLSAGYITTGESIFWTLYLLARHPDAQQRARAEVGPTPPLQPPPCLAAAIHESQRLYPPVWFLGREARRDVRVGEIDIAAGTRVVCSPYVIHRLPGLWPEPSAFRPERFLPGAAIVPRSHFPFGTGMRACIGRGLALIEAGALVGATLARFEVELAADTPLQLASSFSMHPREQVLFHLRPLP